jgi:hypothetical protein
MPKARARRSRKYTAGQQRRFPRQLLHGLQRDVKVIRRQPSQPLKENALSRPFVQQLLNGEAITGDLTIK